jgi:hypothetical protein
MDDRRFDLLALHRKWVAADAAAGSPGDLRRSLVAWRAGARGRGGLSRRGIALQTLVSVLLGYVPQEGA